MWLKTCNIPMFVMHPPPQRPTASGWLILASAGALCMLHCQAEPPAASAKKSSFTPASPLPLYANVAFCMPGCRGGAPCAAQQLVTGAPDGRSVKLGSSECTTLDAIFTDGIIAPRRGQGDMVLHFGAIDAQAQIRVDASRTGETFELVSWVNHGPSSESETCTTKVEGQRAHIDLSRACTFVDNITQLRLTVMGAETGTPSVEIDAVEVDACSFRQTGHPTAEGCTIMPPTSSNPTDAEVSTGSTPNADPSSTRTGVAP